MKILMLGGSGYFVSNFNPSGHIVSKPNLKIETLYSQKGYL